MQTVVPSQVVAAIRKFFPKANEADTLTLRSSQLSELMALVRLVRRVPSQLFTILIEKYVELEQAIEIIEQGDRHLARESHLFQISPVAQTGKSAIRLRRFVGLPGQRSRVCGREPYIYYRAENTGKDFIRHRLH